MASFIHKELSGKVLGLSVERLPVGYLLNFANTRVEWKRFVNQRE